MDTKHSEEFYADFWSSDFWGAHQMNEDERIRGDRIIRQVRKCMNRLPSADIRILDVGCGRGWLTNLLSKHGRVIGVDPTQAAITRARELFPEAQFQYIPPEQLSRTLGESGFDIVVASEVIEHVPRECKTAFLSDLFQVMKPGAIAVFTTPRRELWEKWKSLNPTEQPVEDWLTEVELHELCSASGFKILTSERIFVPHYPFDALNRFLISLGYRRWLKPLIPSKVLEIIRDPIGIYQLISIYKPVES